jgi:hypothetical protein
VADTLAPVTAPPAMNTTLSAEFSAMNFAYWVAGTALNDRFLFTVATSEQLLKFFGLITGD